MGSVASMTLMRRPWLSTSISTFDPEQDDAVTAVQNFLLDGVSRGTIPPRQFILIMAEQGVITLTDSERNAVASGAMGPLWRRKCGLR